MTGILLAGEGSSRLGRDKALEMVGGRTLLQRVVDALAQVSDDIVVVTAPDQPRQRIPSHPLVRVVHDMHAGRGPAAGLYAGLLASRTQHAWALSCDLPFLNSEVLRFLMGLAHGYDAVVPRVGGSWRNSRERELIAQPLHAVYGQNCIPVLERLLKGRASLHGLLERVNTRYVEEDELVDLDPSLHSFLNVNSEEDLALAQGVADRMKA